MGFSRGHQDLYCMLCYFLLLLPKCCQEHHAVPQTQPSSSTLPVPSTSSPPVQSPPPIPASIPTPTPIPETEPEPFEHTLRKPLCPPRILYPHRTGPRTNAFSQEVKERGAEGGEGILKEGMWFYWFLPLQTKVNASGEEQMEDISPNTLEAAKTLSRVATLKPKSIDKGRIYKRRKETKGKKVVSSLVFQEEVDAGAKQVNTGSIKLSIISEQVSTGKEEELNEQQKKRRAQVQFEAQHYTDEDWDLIRAKIEANAELKSRKELDEQVKQVEAFAPINFEATKARLKRLVKSSRTKDSKRNRRVIEVRMYEPSKKSWEEKKKQMARKGCKTYDKMDSEVPSIATYMIIKQGGKWSVPQIYGMGGPRGDLEKAFGSFKEYVVKNLLVISIWSLSRSAKIISWRYDDFCRVNIEKNIKDENRLRIAIKMLKMMEKQLGTDISKITRKPSKKGKARTQERKSEQKPEAMVKPQSNCNGEARDWLDKEPPRSILTWDDLVLKFINQFFPPSKTTYLRNEITTFYQKPNETFNEAWERFKGLLRQCPHHGFSELHQLDTFYNSLNTNDQDALDSAAGGNFLDKMPREGLAIIESKSKVRYSRSHPNDSRAITNALRLYFFHLLIILSEDSKTWPPYLQVKMNIRMSV
ncbi:reverse transcriptase domain-containing protein [Tanacetum coccineum]|uniref:Reverse transcriptase domain-containing protein n=1 Tax=Tanacetum coccineum TaxID=301880 RepID=A0ABQ4YV71_9ASTR